MSIPKDPSQKPEPIKEPPPVEPVPEEKVDETPPKNRLEPTRYGDWELNGKCVDF